MVTVQLSIGLEVWIAESLLADSSPRLLGCHHMTRPRGDVNNCWLFDINAPWQVKVNESRNSIKRGLRACKRPDPGDRARFSVSISQVISPCRQIPSVWRDFHIELSEYTAWLRFYLNSLNGSQTTDASLNWRLFLYEISRSLVRDENTGLESVPRSRGSGRHSVKSVMLLTSSHGSAKHRKWRYIITNSNNEHTWLIVCLTWTFFPATFNTDKACS